MSNDFTKPITIDLSEVVTAKDKAGGITLTRDAETELVKILEARSFIEQLYEQVQTVLSDEMQKHNLKRISAGSVIISKRLTGAKFQIDDYKEVDPALINKSEYIRPNSEAIEEFINNTGSFPSGISLKARGETVVITKRKDEQLD